MFRLLVVDDDQNASELIENCLEGEGRQCFAIVDPKHLQEGVEFHDPDLILLDVHMPSKSGVETLRELKENPEHREIPVVMITADADRHLPASCFEHGTSDYLNKPVDPVILLARLKKELAAANARDRLLMANHQLKGSRDLLHKLLDLVEVGLLSFEDGQTLSYINRFALDLIGADRHELLGKTPGEVLPGLEEILELSASAKEGEPASPSGPRLFAYRNKDGRKRDFLLNISRMDPERGNLWIACLFETPAAAADKGDEHMQPERLAELEKTVGMIWEMVREGRSHAPDASEIDADAGTRTEHEAADPASEEHRRKERAALVDKMRQTLHCWEILLGKSKVEFAEESGLWKAHLAEKTGTWRTYTLEKYLKLENLPERPKWRTVLKTARFVLDRLETQSAEREGLPSQLKTMEELLFQSGI